MSTEQESKILPTIKSLCSSQFRERVEVKVFVYDKINQSEGLIYIHDYKISDIDDFGSELKKEYNLLDVKNAIWMIIKNTTSTPLLLTFKEKEPPRFIETPREQAKTKVYEFHERPMSC